MTTVLWERVIPHAPPPPRRYGRSLDDLIEAALEVCPDVERSVLFAPGHRREAVRARWIVIALARGFGHSEPTIGRALKRDPSTVHYAHRIAIPRALRDEPDFAVWLVRARRLFYDA